jgi:carbon starvation protein CstA
MAMIGASIIHPGVYFAMNSSAALIGTTAEQAAQVISSWAFVVTPAAVNAIASGSRHRTIKHHNQPPDRALAASVGADKLGDIADGRGFRSDLGRLPDYRS